MATLRDMWIEKGMNSVEVAAASKCSISTLYKMNRKEDGVAIGTVKRICEVLGITLNDYDALEICPMAERYRKGDTD